MYQKVFPQAFMKLLEACQASYLISKIKWPLDPQEILITFKKGSLEKGLLLTGLVKSNHENFEVKVKTKGNISSPDDVSFSCSCIEQVDNRPCIHNGKLLLYYFIEEKRDDLLEEAKFFHKGHQGDKHKGLTPKSYGTIIYQGNDFHSFLPGVPILDSTFSLIDGKAIKLGEAKDFKGSILLTFQEKTIPSKEDLRKQESHLIPCFSWKNEDCEHKEISILLGKYLFLWESGELFNLDEGPKNFFSFIKNAETNLSMEDYLLFSRGIRKAPALLEIENIPPLSSNPKITFEFLGNIGGGKKNTVDFYWKIGEGEESYFFPHLFMLFFDSPDGPGPVKQEIQFSLENWLANPRKFNFDAINEVTNYFEFKSLDQYWGDVFSLFLEEGPCEILTKNRDRLSFLDIKEVISLLEYIFHSLGAKVFFSAKLERENTLVHFSLAKRSFEEALPQLHSFFHKLGHQFFYNGNKVRSWAPNIKLGLEKKSIDWFDLKLDLSREDLETLKMITPGPSPTLKDGEIVVFTEEQRKLASFLKRYMRGGTEGPSEIFFQLNRTRIFEIYELQKLLGENILSDEENRTCETLLGLDEIPQIPIPKDIKGEIREYQKHGLSWLTFLFQSKLGACLADDMGLGKTLQTILFLDHIQHSVKRVLIVCPVSILYNWQNEFEKFTSIETQMYYGSNRIYDKNAKFVLTTYGILKKEYEGVLAQEEFDVVVFDEVQNLKNSRSLGANAARKIKGKFRVCLTGTPLENDLSEFYNIMDLAVPGIWGGKSKKQGRIRIKEDRNQVKLLAKPFVLRRTKSNVLKDLPPKIETNIQLHFSEREEEFYKNQLALMQQEVEDGLKQGQYGKILKNLLRLRMMCLWQNESEDLFASTKIDYLRETLQQIVKEGHKVLIFSQFTSYLDLIEKMVVKERYSYSRIDGQQGLKKRDHQIKKFQAGEAKVFLISLRAGGQGLNLTAASYIFLMDPWWNPAVEAQAIDRAYRIGQGQQLTVYRPIIKDSVEEKVLLLQERKKQLFSEIMGESEEEFYDGKLSKEDFKYLFS